MQTPTTIWLVARLIGCLSVRCPAVVEAYTHARVCVRVCVCACAYVTASIRASRCVIAHRLFVCNTTLHAAQLRVCPRSLQRTRRVELQRTRTRRVELQKQHCSSKNRASPQSKPALEISVILSRNILISTISPKPSKKFITWLSFACGWSVVHTSQNGVQGGGGGKTGGTRAGGIHYGPRSPWRAESR